MKTKIDEEDCLRQDLKTPKGYRIIEDWELCKELRINAELKRLAKKGCFWCNTLKGISMAGSYYYRDQFRVSGDDYLFNHGCYRGVFVKIGDDGE